MNTANSLLVLSYSLRTPCNTSTQKETDLKECHHRHSRVAILRTRDYMKALQGVYARGSATMHARDYAHSYKQIYSKTHDTNQQKQSNPPTCTDSFTLVSLEPVPSAPCRHVAEFLQWCVRKCAHPISVSHELCLIQCKR